MVGVDSAAGPSVCMNLHKRRLIPRELRAQTQQALIPCVKKAQCVRTKCECVCVCEVYSFVRQRLKETGLVGVGMGVRELG